jgi:hypothetical protein
MGWYKAMIMVSILAIVAGPVGCDDGGDGGGGDGGGGDGGSCQGYAGTQECLEYTGSDWTAETAGLHCGGMAGTYSGDSCPTSGIVGRCTITSGDPSEYYHVYYERPEEAEEACALNQGEWEAG